MEIEESKPLVRRWNDERAFGQPHAYATFLHHDHVVYGGEAGHWPPQGGREALAERVSAWLAEHRDSLAVVQDIVPEGDFAALRGAFTLGNEPVANAMAFY